MIRLSSFPFSSAALLRETGELVDVDGAPTTIRSAKHVILSRALCSFAFLRPSPDFPKRQARLAAFLHAEAHAPFTAPGVAVFGDGRGFGVWWWDALRIEALLGGDARALRFTPESMAHSPGQGWRMVRGADGYEAQFWRDGRLQASQWRRGAFDDLSWGRFAESIPEAGESCPDNPPGTVTPAWRRDDSGTQYVVRANEWSHVEAAGWMAAGLSAALAIAVCGHMARYDQIATQPRAERAQSSALTERLRRDEALVRAASASVSVPEHLIAAADLLVALETAGLETQGWESDSRRIRASAIGEAETGALGARLEANPRLRNVAPLRANGMLVVTADVERSGAALADATP